MADLIFVGQFISSKAGATGLTVTVDVDRYTISDGSRSSLVTAGSATEGRRGLYHYRLASADLALYQYVCTFLTADTGVDQQEIAALGLVVPDALVSSRTKPADTQAAVTTVTNLTNAPTAGDLTETMKASVAAAVPTAAANATAVAAAILATPANKLATLTNGEIVISPETVVEAHVGSMAATVFQDIRDAMQLAPTDEGDTAAGSVDDKLNGILEDTGTTLPGLFAASGATVTVISSVDGGTITLKIGDTWSFTVTDSTLDLADYETVGLVVKRSDRQPDTAAALLLRSDTGLGRIGGSAPVAAGNGTLTFNTTSFTGLVALAETSASGLAPGQYTWWLKAFDTTPNPDEAYTLATGAFVLERAGLAAVS